MEPNDINKNPESAGPVLGIIIIIALLVVGGMFVLANRLAVPALTADEIETAPDATTDALGTQATSTDLESIEADVNNTNLSNLDAELGQIEAELEAR